MPAYEGMTGNERLGAAGLLDERDNPFRARDRDRMIALLRSVETSEAGAIQTVDLMLKDPSLYDG